MKKLVFISLFLICFISNVFADSRHYERDFIGRDGSGYVTVDVTDIIVFKITVTNGESWFCGDPETIVQAGKQYEISTYPYGNEIGILWENFDGCDDIYEGVTATGTMSRFPSTFDVWSSFRIYCGIWEYDDYFDIEAGTPPTTSTTSSTTTSIIPTTSTTSSTTSIMPSTSTTSTIPTPVPTTTTTTVIASSTTTSIKGCASELIYDVDSEELELLRSIRDNILSQTPEGQEIIRIYYEWSPTIVSAMQEDPQLKEEIKEMVDELMDMLIGEET